MTFKSVFLTYIGPIIAVFAGWLLHEISDVIRSRREHRYAAGQVLAELLNIRHVYRVLPVVMDEIRKRTTVPPEADAMLRTILSTLLSPELARVKENYNKCLDAIAGRFPLLAFELRGKDLGRPLLDQLRPLVGSDPGAAAAFSTLEATLEKEIIPLFDELALKLAKIHGYRTWFQTWRKLKKPDEFPSELQNLFDTFLKGAAGATLPTGQS